MSAKWIVKIGFLILLSGCADSYHPFQPVPGEAEWSPTITTSPDSARIIKQSKDGGLLANSLLLNMFQDRRAYEVGDILTVILDEETQASKRANSGMNKSSSTEGKYTTALPGLNQSGSIGFGAERNFKGGGNASQQNTLSGSISVTVANILPTGVLQIRGEKWIKLNQGDEYIRLTGLVRIDDIDKFNQIGSKRIADAKITYAGRGALAEVNQQGWLTRFFNSGWFPF